MIAVLYDGGLNNPSISFGRWDGNESIAIRWNGNDDPGKGLGNPQSTGHATWFVLPTALALATLRTLIEKQAIGDPAVRAQGITLAIAHYRQIAHMTHGLD